MKRYKELALIAAPLAVFLAIELLLVESAQNIIIAYAVAINAFILLAAKSKDKVMRNYWGVLILPLILRIVNLSLPFPIMNPKLQLMVTYTIVMLSAIFWMKRSEIGVEFLKMSHHTFRDFTVAIIIGIALGSVEYLILGGTPLIQSYIFEDAIFIIYIVLMIGLGEELVYRGLLQTIQTELFGVKGALFLTSVLFGIMHLIWRNPLEFFFTTFAGFLFGYQLIKTKSIWPPVLAHALNNFTWLLIWPILTGARTIYLPF